MLWACVLLFQLLATAEEVGTLNEELQAMQPLLKKAQIETEETMVEIERDTVSQGICFRMFLDHERLYLRNSLNSVAKWCSLNQLQLKLFVRV